MQNSFIEIDLINNVFTGRGTHWQSMEKFITKFLINLTVLIFYRIQIYFAQSCLSDRGFDSLGE